VQWITILSIPGL